MKSLIAALIVAFSAPAALAQTPAPPVKPKPVATVPVSPAKQTPADTARAMQQTERLGIQSDLAWTGFYNGAINGEVSDRMLAAIKAFQKDQGSKDTGVLNPQERTALAAASKKAQDNVGWKVVTDMVTGARVGIPGKLLTQQTNDANGTRWSAPQGTVQVQLARRKEAGATIAAAAEREKKEPAGRKIDYSAVRPDFFVLSGLQGLKKFYLRGQISGDEVRVLTILYDQATEGTMAPVVIAMSSAFAAFPGAVTAQAVAAPVRKKVEYATGIVANADGFIVTDRQAIDGCQIITIPPFGNADRIAEDKDRDLALLRIYGANGLKPLAINNASAAKQSVAIYGIADPQSQSGGAAVTNIASSVTANGNDITLSPPPAVGFSGAATFDPDGKFVGMAQLKPAVITTGATTTPTATAVVVPANAIRDFLGKNSVTTSAGNADAKSSVVRVICIRK